MGSDSDLEKVKKAFAVWDELEVEYEVDVISAHRTPDLALRYAETAEERGIGVIVAAAGLAAHLPGVLAAKTVLPVIGLPVGAGPLAGTDALYSIVQMPPGIPVATVGIDNPVNAAYLAVQILAVSDGRLREKLRRYRQGLEEKIRAKNQGLRVQGLKGFVR
ncbi:MAG: 5-(carboxyamino)imidazole ribonucleotide mutase [Firmicutes bacterium]|nr:5-(carboxyamino)imidazole ribonucleotide mutase [Bacillota bacterium]